jgi:cytochrome c oxidase cbb3-type subunit I/II
MAEPTATTPGSIMPRYPWLYEDELNTKYTKRKLEVMRQVGVPYSDEQIKNAVSDLQRQAQAMAEELFSQGVPRDEKLASKEIVALIAYMQRLGTDIKR